MKAFRGQESSKGFYRGCSETHENVWKPIKIYDIHEIHTNPWKSITYATSPQRTRSQLGIEQRFLQGQQVRQPEIHENLWKSLKIYEIPRNTMEVLRGQEASLESTKGFFQGSRSNLTGVTSMLRNPWKSISASRCRNQWKSMKTMKIYKKL